MANTSRMNRLEELGRVDAEKAYTGKGKRNLRDEKKRIVRELKADGGYITKKKKPSWITKKKKDPSLRARYTDPAMLASNLILILLNTN